MMRILPSGLGWPRVIKSTKKIHQILISRLTRRDCELTDSLSVLVSLSLSRRTRTLSVVRKLMSIAVSGDSVRVYHRCTTTSDHCPYMTLRVEDGGLERGTGGCVELLDISFLLGQVTIEGRWPDLH